MDEANGISDERTRGRQVESMINAMLTSDRSFAMGMQAADPLSESSKPPGRVTARMDSYEEHRGGFEAVMDVSGDLRQGVFARVTGFLDGDEPVPTKAEAVHAETREMGDGSTFHVAQNTYSTDIVDGRATAGSYSREDGSELQGHLIASTGSFVLIDWSNRGRTIVDPTPEQAAVLHSLIVDADENDKVPLVTVRQHGVDHDGPLRIDGIGASEMVDRDVVAFDMSEASYHVTSRHREEMMSGERGERMFEEARRPDLVDAAHAEIAARGGVPDKDIAGPTIQDNGLRTSLVFEGDRPYVAEFALGADGRNAFQGIRVKAHRSEGEGPESAASHSIDVSVAPDGTVSAKESRRTEEVYLATEAGRLYAIDRYKETASEVVGGLDGADLRAMKAAVVAKEGMAQADVTMSGVVGEGPVRIGSPEIRRIDEYAMEHEQYAIPAIVKDYRDSEAALRGGIMSQAASVSQERGADESRATAKGPEQSVGWMSRIRSALGVGGRD